MPQISLFRERPSQVNSEVVLLNGDTGMAIFIPSFTKEITQEASGWEKYVHPLPYRHPLAGVTKRKKHYFPGDLSRVRRV